MSVSFYLNVRQTNGERTAPKEAKVVARITWSRTGYLYYSSGVSVPLKFWSDKKGFIVEPGINSLYLDPQRQHLTRIKQLAEEGIMTLGVSVNKDSLRQFIDHKLQESSVEVKKQVTGFTKYMEAKLEALPKVRVRGEVKRWSDGTIKNKKQSIAALKAFEEHKKKKIVFSEIDKTLYTSVIEYFEKTKGLGQATIGRVIKDWKVFISMAKEEGYPIPPTYTRESFFVARPAKQDPAWLKADQVEKVAQLDLSARPSLDRIRDAFLIGCYSGLRISDFSTLTESNIVKFNGREFIRIAQIKTGDFITIPLHPTIRQILNKYEGTPKVVENQPFNRGIKEILELAEIDRAKEFTSHSARRSFATNYYLSTRDLLKVSRALGHSDLKVTSTYIAASGVELGLSMADDAFFNPVMNINKAG